MFKTFSSAINLLLFVEIDKVVEKINSKTCPTQRHISMTDESKDESQQQKSSTATQSGEICIGDGYRYHTKHHCEVSYIPFAIIVNTCLAGRYTITKGKNRRLCKF